jgi:hypothetical protein
VRLGYNALCSTSNSTPIGEVTVGSSLFRVCEETAKRAERVLEKDDICVVVSPWEDEYGDSSSVVGLTHDIEVLNIRTHPRSHTMSFTHFFIDRKRKTAILTGPSDG